MDRGLVTLIGMSIAYVASFVGWAPARDPAMLAVVVIDEPQGSGYHGGTVAAPVFANLARDVLRHLQVAPRRPEGPARPERGDPDES